MAYIQGEGRSQGSLFPIVLDDLVPVDHLCRVIDAFVARLALSELGFERAQAADTGRPGYDPRDLLKLYLYGYLNQIRSSRRLEAECRRNIELMWLLGRLYPDHKSISEFRRMHSEAVTAAGAALIRFARSCGLIRGEWIAIDGSKFRAVASVDSTRERLDLQRYLESVKKADEEQQANIDPSAVQAAVDRLKQHPEPEAGYMLVRQTALPAYNVQTAVDAEHALIVAHAVVLDASDIRCLKPMAEATKRALELETFNVVADAGYSNGEHVAHCEAVGMMPYVPVMRTVNNQGDGTLFGRTDFRYERESDSISAPETRDCYANIPITKTDTRCIKRRLPTVSLPCSLEVSLHTSSKTWFSQAPVRRRAEQDARASHTGSYETTQMHAAGTTVLYDQISHLRTSRLLVRGSTGA